MKVFADNKIIVPVKLKFALGTIENIVGKGENAGNQHFLPFLQCFQKVSISRSFVLEEKVIMVLCLFFQKKKEMLSRLNNDQNGDSVLSAEYSQMEEPSYRQDHTFSMVNLLGTKNSDQHNRPTPASNKQDGKHNQPLIQALPSIQETFALCAGTTLSETVVRISDLVKPCNLDIPEHRVQMPQSVVKSISSLQPTSNLQRPTDTVQDMNSGESINDHTENKILEKPPYSYAGLIILAIDTSEDKMLSMSDVKEKLKSWFPFFNGKYTGWKSSVRQTLSKHPCFYKAKPDIDSRGHIWAVNYFKVKPSDLVRQKRRNINAEEYKYYLNEQVSLPPVELPLSDQMCDVKKSADLKMPPKPSFGSEAFVSPIRNKLDHDFMCARTDDMASELVNPRSTETPHIPLNNHSEQNSQLYKRPAESSQTETNPKRSKTVAEVSPTFSEISTSAKVHVPETNQMTLIQTDTRTFTADTTSCSYNSYYSTNPDDLYGNRIETIPFTTYRPLEFYDHLSQNWPYSVDTHMYNQSPVFNGYHGFQAFNIPQYNVLQSYSVWPYQNSYPVFGGFNPDGFGAAWSEQAYEPQPNPVNLCKN